MKINSKERQQKKCPVFFIHPLRRLYRTSCHTLKQVQQNATNNLARVFLSGQLLILFEMACSGLVTVLHPKALLLIGFEISTANQNSTNKWVLMATWRAKQSTPEIAFY